MTSTSTLAPRETPRVAIRRRRKPATPYLLLIPAVAVLLVGLGYPVYWQVVTSLQEFGMMQQFGAPPTFVGLDNYARIFADDRLWAVVGRSIVFCLVNAFVTVAIGLGFAMLMRAVHGAVRIVMQVVLLLAWATPLVAAVTVFRWLFDYRTGVVNWLLVQIGFEQYQG
ncbi:MAG: carbohydrate ABC transporter permease, partial [Actinomycetes bacterium]